MKLYYKVSDDKYELPIGVCTYQNIQKVHGCKATSVCSSICKKGKWRRIEIEEDNDVKKDSN